MYYGDEHFVGNKELLSGFALYFCSSYIASNVSVEDNVEDANTDVLAI